MSKTSASAFGITLDVPRAGFRVTQGNPKYWTRNTDSGGKLRCVFCPACGSRLWHESEPASDDFNNLLLLRTDHQVMQYICTGAIQTEQQVKEFIENAKPYSVYRKP